MKTGKSLLNGEKRSHNPKLNFIFNSRTMNLEKIDSKIKVYYFKKVVFFNLKAFLS